MKGERFAAIMGLLSRLLRGLDITVPGADQELFEGGVGGIKRLAAPDIGFAVEIAVVGFVDALDLFARLADERGEALPVRGEGRAQVGLHQSREFGLLGGIEAGDDGAHGIPLEAEAFAAQSAGSHVFGFLDGPEGGVQHVEEAAGAVKFQERRAEGDEEDIRRRQPVDREVAEGGRGVEEDEIGSASRRERE